MRPGLARLCHEHLGKVTAHLYVDLRIETSSNAFFKQFVKHF